MAGPNIAQGMVTTARVGLHDVAQTLLELTGHQPFDVPDSRSFMSVLGDPAGCQAQFIQGYAGYFGGRYILTQRIVWDDQWKVGHNGFDFDECYDLGEDPYAMRNLAGGPAYRDQFERLTSLP